MSTSCRPSSTFDSGLQLWSPLRLAGKHNPVRQLLLCHNSTCVRGQSFPIRENARTRTHARASTHARGTCEHAQRTRIPGSCGARERVRLPLSLSKWYLASTAQQCQAHCKCGINSLSRNAREGVSQGHSCHALAHWANMVGGALLQCAMPAQSGGALAVRNMSQRKGWHEVVPRVLHGEWSLVRTVRVALWPFQRSHAVAYAHSAEWSRLAAI